MNLSNNISQIANILNFIGERVEGNLICDVSANNLVIQRNLDKIKNLEYLSKDKKRICEVGINAGHSLVLMLEQNNEAEYFLFDLNNHKYTEPCLEFISKQFPNTKIKKYFGDSKVTINNFSKSYPQYENTFDLIHIDGGHNLSEIISDFESTKKLASSDCIFIFDDYDYPAIKNFIDSKISTNEIEKVIDENLAQTNLHFVYKLKK
jgi:predicted O-methyltransferase YrrM